MYAYTEDQDKLLFEYLPNIYMTNDNTDVGEVSCINTCNVFFCGASNYGEKRMSDRNNQRCLNLVEMLAFGSCIWIPGFMSTICNKLLCVLLNRKINRKLNFITSKPSHIPNALPCLYQETPKSSIKPISLLKSTYHSKENKCHRKASIFKVCRN
jgi:hypothetical protein